MDLFTTLPSDVEFNLNGVPHNAPRFLLPQMKEYAVKLRKEQRDEATAHLSKDEKARILLFFKDPPADILDIVEWATSVEGAPNVIRFCLKRATPKISDEDVEKVIATNAPTTLHAIAAQFTKAGEARRELAVDDRKRAGEPPLSPPAGESTNDSTGSQEIGEATSSAST